MAPSDPAGARPEADAPAPEELHPPGGPGEGAAPEQDAMLRGYARARVKDEEARARLAPLATGERPLAVTICAVLAAAIGLGNVVLILSGWQLEGVEQPSALQALAPAALMLICAAGLWRGRYWALLAFQVVLTITILFAFLFLLRASNLEAVLFCLAMLAVAGSLFWFLVKAMARTQMSRDPGR